MTTQRVFVYGTLKRGFPNDITAVMTVKFLGRFTTVKAFPLVVGGSWFSPYLISEPGEGHRVAGEIFEVDDRQLAELDRMEGTHLPNAYHRDRVKVTPESGGASCEAWTYFKDRQTINGIHSGPKPEYKLDPRYVGPAERTRPF